MRIFTAIALLILAAGPTAADCSSKPYCGDVSTCAEAYYHLTVCGLERLDRDGDGIPCEKMCGKTVATMMSRIAAQPFQPAPESSSATSAAEPLALAKQSSPLACGTKQYCREMTSCEEARFYLNSCGVSGLDGNRDGIPCNGLCPR